LAEKIIKSGLAGVLNRVLEGLKRVLEQKGFSKSEASNALLNNYKRESDTVAVFMEEARYEKSPNNCKPLGDLYIEYRDFCIVGNYSPVAKRTFVSRLRNHGIIIERKTYGLGVYINDVAKNRT
jgi:putative DNA primase/helicase